MICKSLKLVLLSLIVFVNLQAKATSIDDAFIWAVKNNMVDVVKALAKVPGFDANIIIEKNDNALAYSYEKNNFEMLIALVTSTNIDINTQITPNYIKSVSSGIMTTVGAKSKGTLLTLAMRGFHFDLVNALLDSPALKIDPTEIVEYPFEGINPTAVHPFFVAAIALDKTEIALKYAHQIGFDPHIKVKWAYQTSPLVQATLRNNTAIINFLAENYPEVFQDLNDVQLALEYTFHIDQPGDYFESFQAILKALGPNAAAAINITDYNKRNLLHKLFGEIDAKYAKGYVFAQKDLKRYMLLALDAPGANAFALDFFGNTPETEYRSRFGRELPPEVKARLSQLK